MKPAELWVQKSVCGDPLVSKKTQSLQPLLRPAQATHDIEIAYAVPGTPSKQASKQAHSFFCASHRHLLRFVLTSTVTSHRWHGPHSGSHLPLQGCKQPHNSKAAGKQASQPASNCTSLTPLTQVVTTVLRFGLAHAGDGPEEAPATDHSTQLITARSTQPITAHS